MDNPNAIEAEFCSSFCSKFNSEYCKTKCQALLVENLIGRLHECDEIFFKEVGEAAKHHQERSGRVRKLMVKTAERLEKLQR